VNKIKFNYFFSKTKLKEILKKSIAYDENQIIIFNDKYLIEMSIEEDKLIIFFEDFEKNNTELISKEKFLKIINNIENSNNSIQIKLNK